MINNLLANLYRFICNKASIVVFLSIALCLGLATGAVNLRFNDDYRVYFSDENVDLMAWDNLLDTYSRTDPLIVTIEEKSAPSIFNGKTLTQIRELTEALWQVKYVTRVDSITNFQHIYSDNDEIIVEDLFSKQTLGSPAAIEQRRQVAQSEISINKRMLSDDGKVTGIYIQMMIPKEENAIANAAESIRKVQHDFEQRYDNIDLRLGGIVMLNSAFDEYARADMATLFPIMFLVFCLGIFFLFQSAYVTFCIISALMASVVATFGISGYLGIEFSPHSSIAPHIVFTVAIAMGVHVVASYLQHFRRLDSRYEGLLASMKQNFIPISLAAFTTAIGFLSMLSSEIPPFRDLGIMCAIGVLVSYINTLTLLPALLVMKKRIHYHTFVSSLSDIGGSIARLLIRREILVVSLMLIAIGSAMYGLSSLKIDDHPIKLFEQGTEFRDDAGFIDTNLAGTTNIHFSLDTGTEQGISNPDFLNEVEAFKEYLLGKEKISHVSVISDTLKRVNRTIHNDDGNYFKLGKTATENAQYLLFYESNLPFGQELNNEVDINKSQIRLVATIKSSSSNEIIQLVSSAHDWVENNVTTFSTRGVSVLVMFSYMMERLASNMIFTIGLAVISIAIVLMIALRSPLLGIISLVPNILPIMVVFGIWSYAGKTLDFSAVLIFSMTLGIIVDDTVHICTKYISLIRDKAYSATEAMTETLTSLAPALIISTLVLSVGFLVFSQSVFHMNVTLGVLSALTFLIAIVLDFLLLPIILRRALRIKVPVQSTYSQSNQPLDPSVSAESKVAA